MKTKETNRSVEPVEDRREPFTLHNWEEGLRWRQLLASSAMHLLGALVLAALSALFIPVILEPDQNIQISFLSDAPIEDEPLVIPETKPPVSKPIPEPKPAPVPAPPPRPDAIPPLEVVEAPKPKPAAPAVPEPPPAKVVASAGFDEPKPVKSAPPKAEVRTDLFAQPSSADPDLKAPARNVQTGGFGDPEGIVGEPTRQRTARASLGAFDLPAGPGQGNGSGGARGARGTIASTGFGDQGAAPAPGSASAPRDAVQRAGFAEATAPAQAARSKPRAVQSATLPVEILSKPAPAYTEEARRKRLEGEVVLEVLFTAGGHTQVLRVVSGLGAGLDESAVRAAEKIQFKPARRDGQPVDYTATVRILFQLA